MTNNNATDLGSDVTVKLEVNPDMIRRSQDERNALARRIWNSNLGDEGARFYAIATHLQTLPCWHPDCDALLTYPAPKSVGATHARWSFAMCRKCMDHSNDRHGRVIIPPPPPHLHPILKAHGEQSIRLMFDQVRSRVQDANPTNGDPTK